MSTRPTTVRVAPEHRHLIRTVATLIGASDQFLIALKGMVRTSGNAARPVTNRVDRLEQQYLLLRDQLIGMEKRLRDLKEASELEAARDVPKQTPVIASSAALAVLGSPMNVDPAAPKGRREKQSAVSRRNKEAMLQAARSHRPTRAGEKTIAEAPVKKTVAEAPATPVHANNTAQPKTQWRMLCDRAEELVALRIPDGRGGTRVLTRAEIEAQLATEFDVPRQGRCIGCDQDGEAARSAQSSSEDAQIANRPKVR
jgi:hypothetical protein